MLAAALASRRDAPDAIDAAILAGEPPDVKLELLRRARLSTVRSCREAGGGGRRGRRCPLRRRQGRAAGDRRSVQARRRRAKGDRRAGRADAAKGYRTLGVARADAPGNWRFLGLLPLFDPPRDDSAETIAATRAMGVDVKMVTGDHEAIAAEIAGTAGARPKDRRGGGRLRRRTPRSGRRAHRRGGRLRARLPRA